MTLETEVQGWRKNTNELRYLVSLMTTVGFMLFFSNNALYH